MTTTRTFQQQAEASVTETIEDATNWIQKGKRDRALKVVRGALADAEGQIGKVTMPGAAEALAWGIAQLKSLLATVEAAS